MSEEGLGEIYGDMLSIYWSNHEQSDLRQNVELDIDHYIT